MPPNTRVMIAACWILCAGIIAYWILFFFVPGSVQSSSESWYLIFERSFPAADGWTALTLALCGASLMKKRPASLLWGLLAASGLIFLGLMDVLFDLENGMYSRLSFDTITEMILNVVCLGGGAWFITWFWRHRAPLLAP